MAGVDSSADGTAGGVEDIIANVRQLIFAKGLLQRIRQLLTLARRSREDRVQRNPQVLLRLWIATDRAPDPGGVLLQRRHNLLLRARCGVESVRRCRCCYRYRNTGKASDRTQMPTKTLTSDVHDGYLSRF